MKKILFSLLLIGLAVIAEAQTIAVQGVLRDRKERALDDGFYAVTFKIYGSATGGTALWSDTYSSLELRNGVFQVNLGENASIAALPFDQTYYVGIAVEGNAEMTPRLELSIFPYALAINGNSNKFPSNGNVVISEDSLKIYQGDIVLDQGALRLKGGDGRIVFNDGTSLNTAAFGGPAASVNNPSGTTINADSDTTGTGSIHLQIAGQVKATVDSLGAFRVWDGNATINTATGTGDLYVEDALEVDGSISTPSLSASSTVTANSSMTAPIYYDANSASYYLDPSSTSNLSSISASSVSSSTVSASSSMTSPRYNDSNSATYYMDPSGTSVLSTLKLGSGTAGYATGASDLYVNSDLEVDGEVYIDGYIYDQDDATYYLNPNFNNTVYRLSVGTNTLVTGLPLYVASGTMDPDFTTVSYNDYTDGDDMWERAASLTTWLDFSAIFEDDIAAKGMVCYSSWTSSDVRIKNVIGQSNSASDLETLNKIVVTDYKMKDYIQNDNRTHKKVIAQELKEIYPEAVNYQYQVVPTVYENAVKVTKDGQHTVITTNKAHDFAAGDLVDIYAGDQSFKREKVIEVLDAHTFKLAIEGDWNELFVYGKWVNDFHVVDYEAISMLNVSATQELYRKVQALEAENAALKAEVSTLKAEVNEVSALAEKVATIEKLLQISTSNNTSTVGQAK